MAGNTGNPDPHQLLSMQPVDTGRAIVGSHDGGEYPFRLRDGAWPWVGDLDVLLGEAAGACGFFVEPVLVVNTLLLTTRLGRLASLKLIQMDAQRVLLVGKLVDEVAGIAPKRESGVGFGGVEG